MALKSFTSCKYISCIIRSSHQFIPPPLVSTFSRGYSNTTETLVEDKQEQASKSGGFAKAFDKQSQIREPQENIQSETFATLLRNSKLVEVSNKLVIPILIKNVLVVFLNIVLFSLNKLLPK